MTQVDILADCPTSVGAMLRWRTNLAPNQAAYSYPDPDEHWLTLTWQQTQDRVHRLAAGLLALGLQAEQRVAIVSGTRMEWILADLAINCAGGATTTIYPNTVSSDFAHIVTHSDSTFVIAENSTQVAKIHYAEGLIDRVNHIIIIDGDAEGPKMTGWQQLLDLGAAKLAEDPECVQRTIAATGFDTLATLIYTSGTTGLPKGVELTHRNWVYEGEALRRMEIIDTTDVQYLWLPMSHVFGKALTAIQLAIGFSSAVDGRLDKIMAGLAATKPTFMAGAPRIFEKVRNAVLAGQPRDGFRGRMIRGAFNVGKQAQPYRLAGEKMPFLIGAQYAAADKLVFSKIKDKLGGNMKFMVSGSAKLSSQVQEWFYSAGLLVIEGYGLTETSAVSAFNHPRTPRFGTVGPALPGTEIRIADDGEVLLKGPGIMRGYHHDPELTAEVFTDGWFGTGDIGRLDEDGYLRITDRKKDLMKTSGGKYVAPQKVESVVAANCPYVGQVVAVGDGRKFVSALLVLDKDNLAKWAGRHGKSDVPYAQLTQDPELRTLIERFIARANSHLERWETVKRFTILDHEFTVDDGGVTPNQKLRRSIIVAQHQAEVETMYADENEATA